ncbi:hypothetical protein TCAL_01479 [Tigriopus californicus]|uniref:Uncharacterized protein n=1 Tax=Tigriopus californicus TaxID=6832 RepID=A0A553N814_TIGCA|nr:hypothetical protein TCAL_01479 [Tigriopus californicus]
MAKKRKAIQKSFIREVSGSEDWRGVLKRSPAYDSVRPLAYHEADVFLLCYKISDPISLYNVKNKWIREIRKCRPEAPIVLCGCQSDLRNEPFTISHLSKTGRQPVSQEQALAICCEIEALHYVETSSKAPVPESKDNLEAFELCALAAIKNKSCLSNKINHNNNNSINYQKVTNHNNIINQNNNNNKNNNNNNSSSSDNHHQFQRSPSALSSLSLFDTTRSPLSETGPVNGLLGQVFRRSPSTNSNLSLAANFKMPTMAFKRSSTASVTSLRSPSIEEQARLRTFSPEPNVCNRIPPVISEHETYSPSSSCSYSMGSQENSVLSSLSRTRPSSLHDPPLPGISFESQGGLEDKITPGQSSKLQRPTSLFKETHHRVQKSVGSSSFLRNNQTPISRGAAFFSPMGPQEPIPSQKFNLLEQRFDSVSELGSPMSTASGSSTFIKSPQMEVISQTNAQVRANGLSRRTSYRTHPKMAIPVAAPMSPVGSDFCFDIKSPPRSSCQSPESFTQHSESVNLPSAGSNNGDSGGSGHGVGVHSGLTTSAPRLPCFEEGPKIYESLKSHVSICSQSSDGSSKLPSDFSDASSISKGRNQCGVTSNRNSDLIMNCSNSQTNIESPEELLNNLNFVSPKAGVYRPCSRKSKHNCSIM